MANISKSKGNQTTKFGQLIEHNKRNIFLEKYFTKWAEVTSPRRFTKKSKSTTSLNQQSKILYSLFLLFGQVEDYQNILKVRCSALAFTLKKNKKGLKLVFLPHYLHDFQRKISFTLCSIS